MEPSSLSLELDPWLAVQSHSANEIGDIALWRIAAENGDEETSQGGQFQHEALALFSSREHASRYADQQLNRQYRLCQPDRVQLLRILIDSFQQGIEYAVLDPSNDAARQLFSLREVLKAAREQLS